MRFSALIVACSTLVLSSGCVHYQLSSHEQTQVTLRVQGAPRQLARSLWVTPFFRDDSKRLLTGDRPEDVELLVTPAGAPISPGDIQEVLPAGTHVKVQTVSFPSTWENVSRPILTPRDRPWVELIVDGRPATTLYVLVLRPDLKNEDDAIAEIGKWLTVDKLDEEIARLPVADQTAIRTRELVIGLSVRALELALSPPSLKRIYGDGAVRAEDWTWHTPQGDRIASVRDGLVAKVELPKKPAQ